MKSVFRLVSRLVLAVLILIVLLGLFQVYFIYGRSAKPMERTEVKPGIFVTVEEVSGSDGTEGLVVTTEVYWDTPGVSFELRPLEQGPDGLWNRVTLIFQDWPVLTKGYVALMNTSRIFEHEWHHNYPFKRATFIEPLIERGQLSHYWEHVYMMWWDDDLNATFEEEKPISDFVVENAYWGIGLQGGLVREGSFRPGASDRDLPQPLPISFIGIDAERKVLYLIAFENASEEFAANYATSMGVVEGGRVDSRNGTHLILGRGTGQFLRGVRNLRFLSGYIGVRYDEP
ncbi:MAG: hypothetical protein JJU00_05620 [Opitutales bacterium]|nr:hypothetical protein [Opitutales bacterium]